MKLRLQTTDYRLQKRSKAAPQLTAAQSNISSAFTILEVILAMAVLALLAGAIYAISMAAIQATQETLDEELTIRRLEGFLRITRDAFLNLPANASIYLDSSSNNGTPDLFFENANSLFGIPSLGGGVLAFSARPKPDGTRTFSILRIPKNVQGNDRDHLYQEGNWRTLLPKVIKPEWSFFSKGQWVDEWPQGTGRPQLVRLKMNLRSLPDPIVAIFYLPPISGMGGVPSLDDLLNQLRALLGKNPTQSPPNKSPTPIPTPQR